MPHTTDGKFPDCGPNRRKTPRASANHIGTNHNQMNMVRHNHIQRNGHIILTDDRCLFNLRFCPFTNLRQQHLPIHDITKIQFAVFRAECHKIIRTCIIVPLGTR